LIPPLNHIEKLNRRYQCRRISIKVMQVKNPKLSERQYLQKKTTTHWFNFNGNKC
jgi:hypothetical protein